MSSVLISREISLLPLCIISTPERGEKIDNGQCFQALGATKLPITLMEVLHSVMPLLAPFMENIMSLSAWPLRQNEGERRVRLAAKWSREMRIPSGWQTPARLFEKVSFALILLFWGVGGGGVVFFIPIIWLFIKFNCGSATLHPSAKNVTIHFRIIDLMYFRLTITNKRIWSHNLLYTRLQLS